MISRWFCIDDKYYNLSAFSQLEPCFHKPQAPDGKKYRIRGFLMFPASVNTATKQAQVFVGGFFSTEDECLTVIDDILAGKYDIDIPMLQDSHRAVRVFNVNP